jgi:hypothetical protein
MPVSHEQVPLRTAKQWAKRLQKAISSHLSEAGIKAPFSLMTAQDCVAQQLGHAHWHAYDQSVHPPVDPLDLEALAQATRHEIKAFMETREPSNVYFLKKHQELMARWDALLQAKPGSQWALVETTAGHDGGQLNFMDGVLTHLSLPSPGENTERHQAWLAALRWALDHGFDPNRFNGFATPVGLAGYSDQVDVLEMFRQHGADLVLRLSAQHTNRGPQGLAGTTLLHRLALPRPGKVRAFNAARYLARWVPQSLLPDDFGRTPLNDPEVSLEMKAAINEGLREAQTSPVTGPG